MTRIAIVGAGIAGASLAWHLLAHEQGHAEQGLEVLLLEAESQPGVHATGRSAAMFMESYGPPQVRALTRASRSFYERPPGGFCDGPLLAPRGALYVAWQGQEPLHEALWTKLQDSGAGIEQLDPAATLALCPLLRRDGLLGAISEPAAMDIDVHALHQGFLRGARRAGLQLLLGAELAAASHHGDAWQLQLADGRRLEADVLVDAAGAWADEVARRCGVVPLGLQPCRRSAFTFDAPQGVDHRHWPAVCAVDERWYFKPDAGQLLGSPANADPMPAHDVQPEELDIATGIALIEAHCALEIRRPRRSWAGLRTFSPDGELVVGPDAEVPAAPPFFWLAGQGGYGIQSAAGCGLLAASLLLGRTIPAALTAHGVAPDRVAPARLR